MKKEFESEEKRKEYEAWRKKRLDALDSLQGEAFGKELVILNPGEANGPDGYPKYDPEHAFWKAAAKVVEARKGDAERAREFLKKLRDELRKSVEKNK